MVLSLALIPSVTETSAASAGWDTYKYGSKVSLEFCLPSNAKSPVYLQLMGPKDFGKTVAVIRFSRLKSTSYCADPSGAGSSEPNQLNYIWKTNVVGGYGLQIYVPNLKKPFYGFPDGIILVR